MWWVIIYTCFLNIINLISIWHVCLPVIFHLPHILPQFPLSGIMYLLIQIPMILKCIPYITWLEFLEDPEQFLVRLSSIDKHIISVTEPFPCLYWIKLTLKRSNSCMKFALSEQNLSFMIASIIASQYDFPSTPTGVVGRLDMYRTKVLLYRTMVLLARPTKVRC